MNADLPALTDREIRTHRPTVYRVLALLRGRIVFDEYYHAYGRMGKA
jgi:hypothetical protein